MKFSIVLFVLFSAFQSSGQIELQQLALKYGRANNYALNYLNPYQLTNFDNQVLFTTEYDYDSVHFYTLKFEGKQESIGDTLILNPTTYTICYVLPIIHRNSIADTLGFTKLLFKSFYYPQYIVNGVEFIKNDTLQIKHSEIYNCYSLFPSNYPHSMKTSIDQLVIRINGKTKVLDSARHLKDYSSEINSASGFEVLYMEIIINDNPAENYVFDCYVKIQ